MLRVLRHYFPIRRALLVGSETVLLTLVTFVGMTGHLFTERANVVHLLAREGVSLEEARWRCLLSAIMVSVLAQVAISFNELYDMRVSSARADRSKRFVSSAGSAMVLTVGCVVLADIWGLERVLDFPGLPLTQRVFVLTFCLLVAFLLLYPWRTLFHVLLRRFHFNERVLVVGVGPLAEHLVEEIESRPDSGYQVVAHLPELPTGERDGSDPPDEEASEVESSPHPRGWRRLEGRGGVALASAPADATTASDAAPAADASPAERPRPLEDLVRDLRVDHIVLTMTERRGGFATGELLRCRLAGVVVEQGEDLYERVTGKIAVEALRPSYLIFNRGFVQHPVSAFAKRALDLVLAVVGIVLTWPLMVATAIAVRLDSPGPFLFRQERTGHNGRAFTLCKFRSMRTDAEKLTGPVWASQDDPRITRVGRFIRKTRLDELPQLFNVLLGEMSLVGPRPERPHFVQELASKIPFYEQRNLVKPGLTGWAQINYPYGNTVDDARQKLRYDLFYIKNRSLLFDLSIIFNTVKTVLLRRGT